MHELSFVASDGSERLPESQEVAVLPVVLFSLGMMVTVIITMVALAYAYRRPAEPTRPPLVAFPEPAGPPLPRLHPDPPAQLHAVEHAAQAKLVAWGWVDRTGGIARIPLPNAIEVLAERNWPIAPRSER
jgi:hypothetical protein